MADDSNRSYDPNQAGASGHGGADPLTELARLIGQNDPFSDFAGNNRRSSSPPADPRRANQAPNEWRQDTESVQVSTAPPRAATLGDYGESPASPAAPHMAAPREPHHNTAPFGDPHKVSDAHAQPYYGAAAGQDYGPDDAQDDSRHDRYRDSGRQTYYREMQSPEMYEDDPAPSRRRNGLMTVVAIFALAVGGTAAALGYRAVFSSSGAVSAPPVIKADTTPNKVVPAAPVKDPNSNKLIYDRVGDRNQAERVVTREEQPVEMKDAGPAAPRVIFPDPLASTNPGVASSLFPTASGLAPAPPASTSTPATEPKKVRTVTIRPDQSGFDAPAARAAAPLPSPPAAARNSAAQPVGAAPAETAVMAPAPAPAAAAPRPTRQTIERAQRTQPDANAPISLTPPRATSAPAARTAAVRPAAVSRSPVTAEAGSGSFVQVASQRSEAEAQASFRSVQAKFPDVLGARQAVIRRADLGDKGVYYRAQIGPLSAQQANEMCSNLKAAGGQCLVQRN